MFVHWKLELLDCLSGIVLNISCSLSRSQKYTELSHFTSLFYREQLGNVPFTAIFCSLSFCLATCPLLAVVVFFNYTMSALMEHTLMRRQERSQDFSEGESHGAKTKFLTRPELLKGG